jgi:hypothetical protein
MGRNSRSFKFVAQLVDHTIAPELLCELIAHRDHQTISSSSFVTRFLILKTVGYSPSIKLAIWSLSTNSHFGP